MWCALPVLFCLIPNIRGAPPPPHQQNKPVFSGLSKLYPEPGTSRYVRMSCTGCFESIAYNRITTEEVLVLRDDRYQGRQYVKRGEGLEPSFEIVIPMNPCLKQKIQIRLRYTDDYGEIKEASKYAIYLKEACDIETTDHVLKSLPTWSEARIDKSNPFKMLALLSSLTFIIVCFLCVSVWRCCSGKAVPEDSQTEEHLLKSNQKNVLQSNRVA